MALDYYMVLFEILIFAVAMVVIYIWWRNLSDMYIEDSTISKNNKENFKEGFNDILSNLKMCPLTSKSYISKAGDTLCCEGNINGVDCEGKTICTLSSTNSTTTPSCSKYLQDYYTRKGNEVCPKSMSTYFVSGNIDFCTKGPRNSSMDGPLQPTQETCKVKGDFSDKTSCEVVKALEMFKCPSGTTVGKISENVPEVCGTLGKASPGATSANPGIRIYTKDECDRLGGNFFKGECLRKNGGSYSAICRGLNIPSSTTITCEKHAIQYGGKTPVLLVSNFNDVQGMPHSCYEDNSIFRYLEAVGGVDWKSKYSWLNPDRNILFCSVAKKYFVDKTMGKDDIDI